jgi:mRNA interferase RelE/StbE
MAYRVFFHEDVEKEDIPLLPDVMKIRMKKAIRERLTTNPDLYGKPLRGWMAGLRRLRVGDWRIVYRIVDHDVNVLIIAHRSKVYHAVLQRISL